MHPGSLWQASPHPHVHWSFRSKHTNQKPCLHPKQNLVTLKRYVKKTAPAVTSGERQDHSTSTHLLSTTTNICSLLLEACKFISIDSHGLSSSSRFSSCQRHAFMCCISSQLSVKRTAQSWVGGEDRNGLVSQDCCNRLPQTADLSQQTCIFSQGFPDNSVGQESTCNAGDLVWFLDREDPLEKG